MAHINSRDLEQSFLGTSWQFKYIDSFVLLYYTMHINGLRRAPQRDTKTYLGKAAFHQGYYALSRSYGRQRCRNSSIPRGKIYQRARQKHCGGCYSSATLSLRHRSRTWQPNRRTCRHIEAVPLHVSNPSPPLQHSIVLPLYNPPSR